MPRHTRRRDADGSRIARHRQDEGTESVRGLRFAEGLFSKLGAKQDGANFMTAKRILEAD